jgi:hypothetical protein
MNTQNKTDSAFLNVNSVTRYVLRGPTGQFVASFAMADWTYVLCDDMRNALHFGSMSQALAVGFCLGFGRDMAAVPFDPHQPELFPLDRL